MDIPAQITLFGCDYAVKVVQGADWKDEETVGMFYPYAKEIHVRIGAPQSMEHAYLHELTHAMLLAMGRQKLYEDEIFVDLLSGLLHQALTTAK